MADRVADILAEVRSAPPFDAFIRCLRECGVTAICDSHAHVSSGREEVAPWATLEDVRELPPHRFGTGDIAAFYDGLLAGTGVSPAAVVFETALRACDLAAANDALLEATGDAGGGSCRLVPFAVVTPEMNEKQAELWVARGARGFKVSPRTAPGYWRLSPRSVTRVELDEMLPDWLLRVAAKCRLPVVVHLPDTIASAAIPDRVKAGVERALETHPAVKLVLAHLGLSQTPRKIADTLRWIEGHGLVESVYLDISAVTVSEALRMALESDCRLLFSTDMDFCLVVRGRYVTVPVSRGEATVLVSASFGRRYRKQVEQMGVELDKPLFVYQLEGIMEAVAAARRTLGPGETARRVRVLFFENAAKLLGKPASEGAAPLRNSLSPFPSEGKGVLGG